MTDALPRHWWALGVGGVVCVLAWAVTGRQGAGIWQLVGWCGVLAIGFFLIGCLAAFPDQRRPLRRAGSSGRAGSVTRPPVPTTPRRRGDPPSGASSQ